MYDHLKIYPSKDNYFLGDGFPKGGGKGREWVQGEEIWWVMQVWG